MFYKIKAVFLFALLLLLNPYSTSSVQGQEDLTSGSHRTKYHLSVCSIFKNEAKYLKEWIEYHLLIGVDHFYLYNNLSTDYFYTVLRPYIKKGIVTLINWPDSLDHSDPFSEQIWPLSTQIPAYEHSIKLKGSKETNWLVFLDVDEFLATAEETNLADLLDNYYDYPAVTLSISTFNAAQHTNDRKKLVIESFQLSYDDRDLSPKGVEKMIFQPSLASHSRFYPYACRFQNEESPLALSKEEVRINRYAHRKAKPSTLLSSAKVKLNLDSRKMPDDMLTDLLKLGYEIEDEEKVMVPFISEMRERMGYSGAS